MEAVFSDAVLFVKLIGESIHICIVGHCLMEACVKNSYLRNVHNLFASLDTFKVCRVVKRTEFEALFNGFFHFFGYKNRSRELFGTVENSVTYRTDFVHRFDNAVLCVNKSIQYKLNCFAVVSHKMRLALDCLFGTIGYLMSKGCVSVADLFANTFRKQGFMLHINKLIFKR